MVYTMYVCMVFCTFCMKEHNINKRTILLLMYRLRQTKVLVNANSPLHCLCLLVASLNKAIMIFIPVNMVPLIYETAGC